MIELTPLPPSSLRPLIRAVEKAEEDKRGRAMEKMKPMVLPVGTVFAAFAAGALIKWIVP